MYAKINQLLFIILCALILKSLPGAPWPIFIYIPLLVETNVYGAVALDSWPSERLSGDGLRCRPPYHPWYHLFSRQGSPPGELTRQTKEWAEAHSFSCGNHIRSRHRSFHRNYSRSYRKAPEQAHKRQCYNLPRHRTHSASSSPDEPVRH